jgi:dipeptidyl aminopeptidase/acylaminoacyl peptidase
MRWLAEQEWLDVDRIAVVVSSHGGYSVNMQLLQYPELDAAGLSQVGITDLEALCAESMPHFNTVLERYLGDTTGRGTLRRAVAGHAR